MIEPTNQTRSNSANLLQMIEKIKQNSRIAAQVDYKQELLHGICTSMHWSIQSTLTTKNGRSGHGWRMVAYWTDLSMNLRCRCDLPKGEGNRHGWLRSQAGLYTGSCDWCLAVKFHAGRWKEDARIWRPNPSHICVQELRTTGVRSTEMGVRWGNKGSCQWGACFFRYEPLVKTLVSASPAPPVKRLVFFMVDPLEKQHDEQELKLYQSGAQCCRRGWSVFVSSQSCPCTCISCNG